MYDEKLEETVARSSTWLLDFPGCSVVKNLPANGGDTSDAGSIPGLGSALEKEIATHSGNPWTEEPGRLQRMGSQRVIHS